MNLGRNPKERSQLDGEGSSVVFEFMLLSALVRPGQSENLKPAHVLNAWSWGFVISDSRWELEPPPPPLVIMGR